MLAYIFGQIEKRNYQTDDGESFNQNRRIAVTYRLETDYGEVPRCATPCRRFERKISHFFPPYRITYRTKLFPSWARFYVKIIAL